MQSRGQGGRAAPLAPPEFAALASTGRMVGQCSPMQLIPAPCRISMPQEYGGIPSRAWGYPIVILQYSSTTLCQVSYHIQ
jgi:hypothetical protein